VRLEKPIRAANLPSVPGSRKILAPRGGGENRKRLRHSLGIHEMRVIIPCISRVGLLKTLPNCPVIRERGIHNRVNVFRVV
jgi:hypothetical protein